MCIKTILRHSFVALSLVGAMVTVSSCKASRNAVEATSSSSAATKTPEVSKADKYVAQVKQAQPTATHLTAKAKIQMKSGNKDFSVNGNLRMKRDEVIQLSVRVMGIEVGRMEFTPQGVLVLDRVNSQYVRAAYNDVSYLQTAGLDFYALQSLFWNELFAPKVKSNANISKRFQAKEQSGKICLTLNDESQLTYDFTVDASNSRIQTVKVTPKGNASADSFCWTYSKFEPFAQSTFPSQMKCQAQKGKIKGDLTLTLSSINDDTDWKAQSEIPSKYKQKDLQSILRLLSKLL